MLLIIIAAIVALLAIAFFSFAGAYYARLFSEAHFREFHGKLSEAIRDVTARPEPPSADHPPSAAFVTGGGVKTAVTFSPHSEGRYTLHISLSQSERATTQSFAGRFGFFIVAMLQGNKAELTPYFTPSGVAHLSFQLASPAVAIEAFEAAHARYRGGYEPIPFEYRDIEA